jgi:hypothetical protein
MALSREMEVYETESVDSDDDDGRERSSTATSEDRLFAADRDKDYERIHLDVHGAMRRFGPCWLDAEGTGPLLFCIN